MSKALILPLCLIGFCMGSVGCSRSDPPMSESERYMKALTVFYGQYTGQHQGKGPPNEADFKNWIRSLPAQTIEAIGIDPNNVDKAFISPRDNQPFGIAYRTKVGAPTESGAGMVIWEQLGSNGKHYVADAVGKIEEIDDTTFRQRLAAVLPAK